MRIIIAALLMFSTNAYAGCLSINDMDQRNYCIDEKTGSGCNSINDMNLRNVCESETSH